jgi:hypothetical protein
MKRQLPTASHYQHFNVLDEQEHWDDHTRKIVTGRLEFPKQLKFLTEAEAQRMVGVCRQLIGDSRAEILEYIVRHIDNTLSSDIGESERKQGVPKTKELVRGGLSALEQAAQEQYQTTFSELDEQRQKGMLQDISEQRGSPEHVWQSVPQKPLFTKWLSLTVEAYYSHPYVWSEIGYAGPAYPRGYVRAQLGQLDPWEPHPTKQAKSDQ